MFSFNLIHSMFRLIDEKPRSQRKHKTRCTYTLNHHSLSLFIKTCKFSILYSQWDHLLTCCHLLHVAKNQGRTTPLNTTCRMLCHSTRAIGASLTVKYTRPFATIPQVLLPGAQSVERNIENSWCAVYC